MRFFRKKGSTVEECLMVELPEKRYRAVEIIGSDGSLRYGIEHFQPNGFWQRVTMWDPKTYDQAIKMRDKLNEPPVEYTTRVIE